MNIIRSFTIEGLWGVAPVINIDLDDQFNFIIGRNGTGKTTVINLLAAVLVVDYERLDRIEFSKVKIVFKQVGKKKSPSLEVKKTSHDSTPFSKIVYSLKASSKEPSVIYDIDNPEHEKKYWGTPSRIMARYFREHYADIRNDLREMINVSWLSVHRTSEESWSSNEERKFGPAIDQKLKDLNNSLVRYFSTLTKKYADHTLEFQKKSFLSVLTPERASSVFSFAATLDLDKEKATLGEIFQVLGVEHKNYNHKLRVHFEKLTKTIDATSGNQGGISVNDFATLYNAWQAHSLVNDYEELQSKKTEIFKPKDTFIKLMNMLFEGRKRISVSEKNEITFSTDISFSNGNRIQQKDVPLEELSSGEKQLLIILGEALLQQSTPSIYIADEPELSLHVYWQEQITSAISQLNSNAQIVFATHSPDIVGQHNDKIINMEEILL
ncbi:AAA family ATPase [Vreelandella aquamarina]|uniref:AAA family ATPase n=1 Tax=Vreelandella aquamarina TaxID=77097 RepID=UPI00384D4E53